MAKVIGFRKSSFKGDTGDQITGVNVYVSFPLDNGEGVGCDRIFMLDRRLAECGYTPKLSDERNKRQAKGGPDRVRLSFVCVIQTR